MVVKFDVKIRKAKDNKKYGVISVSSDYPNRLLCVDYETGDLLSFYADECVCLNITEKKVKV